jgi:hypothetical protein
VVALPGDADTRVEEVPRRHPGERPVRRRLPGGSPSCPWEAPQRRVAGADAGTESRGTVNAVHFAPAPAPPGTGTPTARPHVTEGVGLTRSRGGEVVIRPGRRRLAPAQRGAPARCRPADHVLNHLAV